MYDLGVRPFGSRGVAKSRGSKIARFGELDLGLGPRVQICYLLG